VTVRGSSAGPSWALLGATAIWGGTFVTVKDALESADAFTFLALRFTVGALVAGAFAWPHLRSREVWRRGGLLGLLLYVGYALQTVGLETTSPARSAFITGLTVIFVPFVSWGLARRRPSFPAFLAPLLALVGLQQLTGFTWSGGPLLVGDVLTLGCAVVYAGHIATTSHLAERARTAASPWAVTAVQLAVTAALATASLPFVDRRLEATPGFWGAVVFTGVFASALAIGVQVWAQQRLTAVRAAVIYSLEPVFALAWAAAMGAGWPSRAEWVGGGFILAAVLTSEVGSALLAERKPRGAEEPVAP
jgi:drug/metabolite transporter (DMT)-like permease